MIKALVYFLLTILACGMTVWSFYCFPWQFASCVSFTMAVYCAGVCLFYS